MEGMIIRKYTPTDCTAMTILFYETVREINKKDYSEEQLDVWATGMVDLEQWNQSFLEHITWIAVEEDKIIGFGDIDANGYLDRLYVHKDYQRRGVATELCNALEESVPAGKYTTHASITARPFFENRGYRVIKEQQILRNKVALTNFIMEKVSTD